MVSLSEVARNEILKSLNSSQIPAGYALRVGLKGGACSATYLLGLDKATEHDELYDIEGVNVLIDKRHLMYLIGVRIDYAETESGMGFTIQKQ
ncbi:Iron-sulfur cluster insertion protein ErpA [Emticicia aquatica]|jgi:iron-sulfur cluster assembly protein|uniref:Iron-sulfur cluster insertion protein ErpA n=1 Tax=Emticicia aquatica TaxID=1681835 RepID=A0ABM9ATM8_9BACT|nr:iron-sulfur cluster assembly accessory protein [Emticicia aquatica]CAH0997370.1 Iron-sulfur cluster insertion protein ErpA [Emticicia aquatica]